MSDSYEERHGTEPTDDTGCEGLIPEPQHECDGTCPSCQAARHVEIRIDGLPGQLQPGHHAVTFSDMEYSKGAGRPVIRFRYAGRLADDARIMHQIEQVQREDEAAGAPAGGWLLPPAELPAVYRTRSGKIVTEAMIEEWVAEAERGYDLDQLIPRRDHTSPPQPAQQVPDLYQVSTVETINVSKLARVIAALLRKGVLDADDLGVDYGAEGGWPGIERWLRA